MKKFLGVLILVGSFFFAQTALADLVINGGFEFGNFNGWQQSGNPEFTSVNNHYPNSGTYAAEIGPQDSLGYLSQTLATTSGQSYEIRFWLGVGVDETGNWTPNQFTVSWGGATFFNQSDISPQEYTLYRYIMPATGSTTDLTFGFRDDPAFLYLDDVSVNAVPLPGTLILLGSGLFSLLGWKRMKKS